jgi:hypothetical protein
MNGVEQPVRREAEGLGGNEDDSDLPIKTMPLGVACSMPEDNEDLSSTGTLTEEAEVLRNVR